MHCPHGLHPPWTSSDPLINPTKDTLSQRFFPMESCIFQDFYMALSLL